MLFSELPLYLAVHEVRRRTIKPGSDEWITGRASIMYQEVLRQIVDDRSWTPQGIPWSMEHAIKAWRHMRKVPKLDILCRTAKVHGSRCFYAGRGVGHCSDEIDLDRILPEARGGIYSVRNCIIACSGHNRSRGDKTIEQFLEDGWQETRSALADVPEHFLEDEWRETQSALAEIAVANGSKGAS